MSKEYIAEHPFDCTRCGEEIGEGEELFFSKDGKKICGQCHDSIMDGDSNEKYDEDGFGRPE